jgi:hypothetical protein
MPQSLALRDIQAEIQAYKILGLRCFGHLGVGWPWAVHLKVYSGPIFRFMIVRFHHVAPPVFMDWQAHPCKRSANAPQALDKT